MLYGMAYCSLTEVEFDENQLLNLADSAAEKNQHLGISGYLYYRDYVFLQYLEGGEKEVESLMAKITQDPRHTVITTVRLPTVLQRKFPHWYMRFLGNDLPRVGSMPLEEELSAILEVASKEQMSSPDVADAILHVTDRIVGLDWQ